MQKVHVLLHPTLMATHAAYADSRRLGRVEGKVAQGLLDLNLRLTHHGGALEQGG